MILPPSGEKTGVGSWPPKALDARGGLSIRHYEQCLFERAEDAKAFIEEGYRTGQRGDHFTVGPMKLIQDGSLGARTAAMMSLTRIRREIPGSSHSVRRSLTICLLFLTSIRCRQRYTVSAIVPWIWSLRQQRNLLTGRIIKRADMVSCIARSPIRVFCRGMKDQDLLAYIQPVFIDLDMNTVEPAIGDTVWIRCMHGRARWIWGIIRPAVRMLLW